MNSFSGFLVEHLPATIIAFVGFVGSIVSIWEAVHNHIKRGKRQYFLIAILLLIFVLSILYLLYQYSIVKTSVIPQLDDENVTVVLEKEEADHKKEKDALPENTDDPDGIQHIDADESAASIDNKEDNGQSADNGGTVEVNSGDVTAKGDGSTAVGGNENNAVDGNGNIVGDGNTNVSNDGSNNAIVNGSGIAVSGNGNTILVDGENNQDIPVTVSSVALSKSQIDMCVGDSCILTATVLYSDNSQNSQVTWISSDETVIKVDDGHVSAISPGTAKITAQASINNSAKDASCTVVVAAPPSGYSISLSTYKTTLESPFYIYITPYDDDITSIKVYAKSPSGNIYTYFLSDTGQYFIYTEVGIWTIYASVENQAGIYEASRPDDFVTIEITPITFDALDALFPGIG